MDSQAHILYNQLHEDGSQEPSTEKTAPSHNGAEVDVEEQSPEIAWRPTAKKQRSFSQVQGSLDESWIVEWLALLCSALFLTAIVVVLNHFDNRKLPGWHLFSLNTLISFLSTAAETCLALPIGTSIGQLKWVWFADKQRPLSYLAAFDAGGRDVVGSANLLIKHRFRHFAGFACAAMILMLGFGPFLQNLIHTFPKLVVEDSRPALVANTYKYRAAAVGDLNDVVDPVLKSNVYDSLLNPDHSQPWAIPKFTCPSSNCSWTDVTSFYVRPTCVDLTSKISTSCNHTALNCTIGVKNGPSLTYATGLQPQQGSEVFPALSQIINISYSGANDITFGKLPSLEYVRALDVPNIFSKSYSYLPITNRTSFVATSCSFDICAQLSDIDIRESVYREQRKQLFCNGSYPVNVDTWGRFDNRTQYLLAPDWASDDSNPPTKLAIGVWSYLATYNFLSSLFDGYIVLQTGYAPSVGLDPAGESRNYATSDVLQAVYNGDMSRCEPGTDNLVCAATNVAKAITKSFRDSEYVIHGAGEPISSGQSNGKVTAGDTFVGETFVRIDWWWLTLPIVVWILGTIALSGTVLRTKRARVPRWRDNLLPLLTLYHNSGMGRDMPTDVRSNGAWEEWAGQRRVHLKVDGEVARLE